MADVVITTRLDGISRMQRELRGVERSVQSLGRKLEGLGRSLTFAVTLPLVAAAGALAKFGIAAVESENLFEKSMGDMASEARAFSEELADSLNLNAFAVRKQIGTFNQMLTSMTGSTEAAFAMSKGLVQLTQDMASFFDLKSEDAFLKLQSAISGEIEPLRRLGIIVSETTVKQTLLNRGLIEQGDKLTEAQKVMGRYLTILEQTANAQGDMADTINDPANALRGLRAQLEQTATELGIVLMPTIQTFIGIGTVMVGKIKDMAEAFKELSPETQKIAISMAGLAVVIGPAAFFAGKLAKALAVVVAAALVLTSPIAIMAAGFLALGIAISTALPDFETMGRIFDALKAKVAELGAAITEKLAEMFPMTVEVARATLGALGDRFGELFDFVGKRSGEVFSEDAPSAFGDMLTLFNKGLDEFQSSVGGFLGGFSGDVEKAMAASAEATKKAMADTIATIEEQFKKSRAAQDENANKTVKQIEASAKRERNLAVETMAFKVRIGEATTEQLIALLNEQLETVEGNAADELRIRKRIADTIERDARKAIREIDDTTDSIEEQRRQLGELAKAYEAMGAEAVPAIEAIAKAMGRLEEETTDNTFGAGARRAFEEFYAELSDSAERAFDVVDDSLRGFQDEFRDFIRSGKFDWGSFIDTLKDTMADFVADQVIKEFLDVVAVMFGKEPKGGGIIASLFGEASLLSSLLSEESPLATLFGEDGPIATLFSAEGPIAVGFGVLGETMTTLGATLFDLGATFVSSIVSFGTQIAGFIGSMITSVAVPLVTAIGTLIGSIFTLALELALNTASLVAQFISTIVALIANTVALITNTIALGVNSVLGIFGFQTGGSRVFTSPSLIRVAETGPERVFAAPLAGGAAIGGGGAGVQINFAPGSVVDQQSLNKFVRKVGRELNRRHARGLA